MSGCKLIKNGIRNHFYDAVYKIIWTGYCMQIQISS